ncbi:MAG TPA: hypothetical protein VF293_07195 [Candidatus Limnocylindrales bacterium]|jgi:putative hemolysin
MARTRAREALTCVAALSVLFLLAACSSAPAATRAANSAPAATRAASATPTASAPGGWVKGRGSNTPSTKCGGLGGDWVIEWAIKGASEKFVATIDETTLTGPYTEITWQTYDNLANAGYITTATHGGTASLVVQADGSVVMTTNGGQEDVVLTNAGTTTSSTTTGSTTDYRWQPAVDECKGP